MKAQTLLNLLVDLPIEWETTFEHLVFDFRGIRTRVAIEPTYLRGELVKWDWLRDNDEIHLQFECHKDRYDNYAAELAQELDAMVSMKLIFESDDSTTSAFKIDHLMNPIKSDGYAIYEYYFSHQDSRFSHKRKYAISYFQADNWRGGSKFIDHNANVAVRLPDMEIRIQGFTRLMSRTLRGAKVSDRRLAKFDKRHSPWHIFLRRLSKLTAVFAIVFLVFTIISFCYFMIGFEASVKPLRFSFWAFAVSSILFFLLGGRVGYENTHTNSNVLWNEGTTRRFYLRSTQAMPRGVSSFNTNESITPNSSASI